MKMLVQTDKDCKVCEGQGFKKHEPCEKCQTTGKILEWREIVISNNHLYLS